MAETTILLDGLVFPEGPRWRDGKLWLSDQHDHRVLTVDLHGTAETVCAVEYQPSGLGWLPDGRLLVVSMVDRRLLRLEPQGLVEHADLSALATYHWWSTPRAAHTSATSARRFRGERPRRRPR